MAIPNPGYWHVSSAGWTAVTAWAANTVTAVGTLRRQLAAVAVGAERTFICIVAGTTHLTTEPTWVGTKGAKTTDNTVTWQECTGQPFGNGNLRDTYAWSAVNGQAVALGYVISDVARANYFICTAAGTAGGSEPTWDTTAGNTTADNTITWTCIGAVGSFTTAFGNPSATVEMVYLANWGAAGDIFYVADNHAQTRTTALSLTSPGAVATPCSAYCVDRTVVSPGSSDLKTTATMTTTGNSGITFNGAYYYYGITFNCGTGAVAAVITVGGAWAKLENCALNRKGTTAAANAISISASQVTLVNTTLSFGNVGDSIRAQSPELIMIGSSITGATLPTTLFTPLSQALTTLDGCDLSAIAGTVFTGTGRNTAVRSLLNAAATLSTTPTAAGSYSDFIQCDSGATSYFQSRFAYQGTLTQEATIVRSGGASDGTTPLSWKIVTTANSKWLVPFVAFPIAIWNDTVTGNVTATVEIVASGALNNDDVWLEIEYFGSASTPQASFANSTKANNLAAGTTLTASAATWASSPGSAQKLSVTFAPRMKGYLYARVFVAKASQTVYVDPKVTLS